MMNTDCFLFTGLLLTILLSHSQACTVDSGKFYQVLQVKEELPIGYEVGSLNLDNPSKISRITVSEPNLYIQLNVGEDNRSGKFSISRRIDTDTGLDRIQTMYIDCTTEAGLTLEIEIEFDIEDINDHSPAFLPSNTYNFSISERAVPGAQIGMVRAKDGDIKNSHIQYELVTVTPTTGNTVFQLSNHISNGGVAISLSSFLDYETQKSYKLRIIAKDCQQRRDCTNGQYVSTAVVNIEVIDEDDLNPQFDQNIYRVSLSQDAQNGDLVVQVTAHDQDELNEQIEYSLSRDGSEFFFIDSITGKVSVQDSSKLESGNNFLLQVKAAQKTDATKKDVATLIISVMSSDADKPQFTERTYVTSISEYSQVNSSVLSMAINYNLQRDPLVVQLKQPFGQNSLPHFTIRHLGNNVDLILTKKVDFEQLQSHKVNIVASNGKFSDEVEVTIHILNENDNNPLFDEQSYSFHLLRNEPGIVGRVSATDADNLGERIKYRLLKSDVSSLFAMNEDGVITMSDDKGEYTKSSYTLIAEASDLGVPPRTTNAVLTITFEESNVSKTDSSAMRSPILEDRVLYPICAAAILVVLVASVTVCVIYSRRTKQRLRSKRNDMQDSYVQPSDEPAYTPCTERINSSSSLGLMSVMNERRENTYRDMSQLNHDENYRLMWRRSGIGISMENPELNALLEPQNGSNSSDSGNSSCNDTAFISNHHSSQSETDDTINRTEVNRYSPNAVKRGFISTYLQEQKKRQSIIDANGVIKNTGDDRDNGVIFEAPAGFRTPSDSRPASITESTHSDYAVSNTSDYGSNTAPMDSNSKNKSGLLKDCAVTMGIAESRESTVSPSTDLEPERLNVITIKPLNPHQVVAIDSLGESSLKRPFTTFHGDLV